MAMPRPMPFPQMIEKLPTPNLLHRIKRRNRTSLGSRGVGERRRRKNLEIFPETSCARYTAGGKNSSTATTDPRSRSNPGSQPGRRKRRLGEDLARRYRSPDAAAAEQSVDVRLETTRGPCISYMEGPRTVSWPRTPLREARRPPRPGIGAVAAGCLLVSAARKRARTCDVGMRCVAHRGLR